ncbi:MAG: secretin N-terminal domain-containing protein [Burkholderiaceae bacterium]
MKKYFLLLSAVLLCWGSAGCAELKRRQSDKLLAQGRYAESIQVLASAAQANPHDTVRRTALLNRQAEIVNRLLSQALEQRNAGDDAGARQTLQALYRIDPNNERATGMLNDLDRDRRHLAWLDEAQALVKNKKPERARGFLEKILRENARHSAARDLKNQLDSELRRELDDQTLQLGEVKPVSLEFRDANLKLIFEILARNSGVNFILDKDLRVDATATIFLRDAKIEDAIDLLASTNQLSKKILNSQTVLIYPNTPEKQREYQDLLVKSFFLANSEAKTLGAQIKTMFKLREVLVDDKLNALIVRDTPEAIRLAERVIATLDIGEPEVMLEVEVLEINHSRLYELGVNFPNQLTLTPLASAGSALTLNGLQGLNSDQIGVGFSSPTLNLRRELGDVNILANPRIRAKNREKAKILIGDRLPVVSTTTTATGFVAENIQYAEVGIKLDVEPLVSLDEDVSIKVGLEVSSVSNQIRTAAGSLAYQIGTRTASTVLKLKNGETQVLAGLINNTERSNASRIPGLGDIPVLGRLFGSTQDSSQKTEVVLSITPRLIRNIRRPDITESEFWSGTDARLSTRPMALPVRPKILVKPPAQTTVDQPTIAVVAVAPLPNVPAVESPAPVPALVPVTPERTSGVTARAATIVELRWDGQRNGKLNEPQTLTLHLKTDGAIQALPLQIGFDPQMVQIVEVKEGAFFSQDEGVTTFSQQIEDDRVFVSAARNGSLGVFGDETVLQLRYRLLKPGESALKVLHASPLGAAELLPVTLPPPFVLQSSS